jgi:hypothetical protein
VSITWRWYGLEESMSVQRRRFGLVQIGIIVLAAATALIHLGLAIPSPWPFNLLFALNGLGYLALLAGLYANLPVISHRRSLVRLLFIAYTLLTIALFFIMNTTYGTFGLITKAIEVLLVILLIIEKPDSG